MGALQSNNSKYGGNNFRNNTKPSSQPIESTDFRGNQISLDEVYESLNEYKETINNVYSLNSIIDDLTEEIREKFNEGDSNAINTVLLTSLHEDYDKNAATNYCEVIELAKNKSELNKCRILFSCKNYEEIDGESLLNIKMNNNSDLIDNMSYTTMATLLESRIIEMSMKIPAYGNMYIHSGLSMWTEGIRCYFNVLRRHPLDKNNWIMISSGINMKNYTSKNITNMHAFSKEYKLLLESITQVMNSNTYLRVIEDSANEAEELAEKAVTESEEKTAVLKFSQKVYESAPMDPYAKAKLQDAQMAAQTASRMASQAITNAKAAQYAMTEAEAHIATKTTTWEYGPSNEHDSLRCIYSGLHPQWNGKLISQCNLQGSEMDIPGITFTVMSDIEKYYPVVEHNRTILCSYKTHVGYYISIVKTIKHGEEIHIQMKEALLNSIFNYPTPPVNNETRPISSDNSDKFQYEQSKNVNNTAGVKPYVFIDPTTCYIGIGTNQQTVKYTDEYSTTKPHNLQHVVIKSKNYPTVVSTRIAEDANTSLKDNNYYYFDQFSCSTMRRESELYNFKDMYNNSKKGTEANDNIVQRFGGDISFEITDKTRQTAEIGNIGMVIDKIDEDGNVYGGLSVKTIPNIDTINNKETTKPGNTIMYVSSEGLLHISGIMLGKKVLHVQDNEDGQEELFWGENRVV